MGKCVYRFGKGVYLPSIYKEPSQDQFLEMQGKKSDPGPSYEKLAG